ncbi:hypothetical protein ACIRQY_19185 [Streptomyces sp. NPDC101490]
MVSGTWAPTLNRYAVDTSNGRKRYGKIIRVTAGVFALCPPGGGAEWPPF